MNRNYFIFYQHIVAGRVLVTLKPVSVTDTFAGLFSCTVLTQVLLKARVSCVGLFSWCGLRRGIVTSWHINVSLGDFCSGPGLSLHSKGAIPALGGSAWSTDITGKFEFKVVGFMFPVNLCEALYLHSINELLKCVWELLRWWIHCLGYPTFWNGFGIEK